MNRRLSWLIIGLIGLGASSGCGPGHGMTLGRVKGRVLLEGEPVRYGNVIFLPDTAKGTDGPPAMSVLRNDGTYVLETMEQGDGAVVGHHKVGIVGLDPTPIPGAEPAPVEEVEPQDAMKAKLKAVARKAPRGKSQAVETYTDRSGRVYRYAIPKRLSSPETSGLTAEVSKGSNTFDLIVHKDGSAEVK
jgi:hypothetical protein